MATCKDCVHIDVCTFRNPAEDEITCAEFKNKADYAEVKHGYWFEVDSDVGWSVDGCSVCGEQHCFYEEENKANYCPHCGAKMNSQ